MSPHTPDLTITPTWFLWLVLEWQEDIPFHESFFEITGTLDLKGLLSERFPTILVLGGEGCSSCEEMKPCFRIFTLFYGEEQTFATWISGSIPIWKGDSLRWDASLRNFFFDRAGAPFLPVNPEGQGVLKFVSPRMGKRVFTGHEGRMEREEILGVLEEMGEKRIGEFRIFCSKNAKIL